MFDGYLYVVASLLVGLSTGCTFNVNKASGNLTSPNYPTRYSTDMDCAYVIRSPTKQPITVVFEDFEVEDNSDCKHDYVHDVTVQDGISQSAKRLGMFCGKQIPFIPVVFSGSVFLILKSTNLVSGQGFIAEYKEEAFLDCSGYLNAVSGRIQSPNYPNSYSKNTDCEYRIVSPYNESSINLTFLHFELEEQNDCEFDYVEIFDTNKRIGKYCGTQNPVLTFILSSSIRIVFHSDARRNFKGFYATFTHITVYQTTEELPSTLSFSTISNTSFKTSLNSASDNSAVTGGVTGVLIGIIVVIIIVCVMIDRRRRNKKNQLQRKSSEKQPFDRSDHDHYSMENIDHDSTSESDGHIMANGKSYFGTEINVYANDTEMIKEVIVNDDVNNEYSYSNLLTADTANNRHLADNSYYDLSENYNEVNKSLKTCESGQFEGETNGSEYIDNKEAYNILNINPQKTNDTENFDRTIQDVYDKTTHITNTSYPDIGLYDHSTNN